ncbi:hypothetical protein NFI96_004366 [Prochilodus magdalenae]|nr:hypothetical protein NFI96_004366 [Prochilodus magdalenae]
MPGHSTVPNHKSRSNIQASGRCRAEGYRQGRTSSRDSATSQDSYRDHHGTGQELYWDRTVSQDLNRDYYSDRPRVVETQPSHKRYANGRGSETLGFIPGSAAAPVGGGRACGSCSSLGWSGCRALLCCVLTCGLYGNRKPCLPPNESSTDAPPKSEPEPRRPPVLAMTNPTCGMTLEPSKPPQLPSSESFRYRDVYLAGKKVVYPTNAEAPARRSRAAGKGESQRPVSNTSIYSREDLDVDDVEDGGTDIDSLITKKLLELYKLHQIEQLAKCTSDQSFSRKTNEISDLINSIAQDYNLEEQEAECRLVHGVIRISTRKYKSQNAKGYKDYRSQDALLQANGRRDGTLPDSGNETMTFTFSNGKWNLQALRTATWVVLHAWQLVGTWSCRTGPE